MPLPARMSRSAICFDLDGVLIDTMPLHAQAWQSAVGRIGLAIARRMIYRWEGEPGVITARRILSQAGRRASLPSIRRLLHDKERIIQRLAGRVAVSDRLLRVLDGLIAGGMPLSLVTGTSSREVSRILRPEVRARFRVIITGDRLRHGKPHPEPYQMACRRLRVRPRDAMVVENAPYGIRSARAAQVGVVIAPASSLPARFLKEADLVVPSLTHLCAILKCVTPPGGRRVLRSMSGTSVH